jgi:YfiH family protein
MLDPQLTYYQIADNVTAFSSTRHGGVGEGNYGSFNVNCYCGDAPESIANNRRSLCRILGIDDDHLIMPHQVHGTGITQIGKTFFLLKEELRQAVLEDIDALMTNVPHVCIGVSTADCIPIIIYDGEHHAASVVHSGWRGTVANIVGAAVESMKMAYHSRPEKLKAVIGPGISLKNFEVGDEVYEEFKKAAFPTERIARKEEKWHIDLWECVRFQLETAGVEPEQIKLSGVCTYDQVEDYFSARRLGIASGRILTGIILT